MPQYVIDPNNGLVSIYLLGQPSAEFPPENMSIATAGDRVYIRDTTNPMNRWNALFSDWVDSSGASLGGTLEDVEAAIVGIIGISKPGIPQTVERVPYLVQQGSFDAGFTQATSNDSLVTIGDYSSYGQSISFDFQGISNNVYFGMWTGERSTDVTGRSNYQILAQVRPVGGNYRLIAKQQFLGPNYDFTGAQTVTVVFENFLTIYVSGVKVMRTENNFGVPLPFSIGLENSGDLMPNNIQFISI